MRKMKRRGPRGARARIRTLRPAHWGGFSFRSGPLSTALKKVCRLVPRVLLPRPILPQKLRLLRRLSKSTLPLFLYP